MSAAFGDTHPIPIQSVSAPANVNPALKRAFDDFETLLADVESPEQAEPLRCALGRLKNLAVDVEKTNGALRRLAMTDSLTGILNRRAFMLRSNTLRNLCSERNMTVSCLLLDIDYFKQVNDLHGHQAGDRMLVGLAQVLQSAVRSTDLVCRYGGEEFAVFMPAADAEQAIDMAERVRQRIANEVGAKLDHFGRVTITASVGVASSRGASSTVDSLLERADCALYSAKHQGRNRVCAMAC